MTQEANETREAGENGGRVVYVAGVGLEAPELDQTREFDAVLDAASRLDTMKTSISGWGRYDTCRRFDSVSELGRDYPELAVGVANYLSWHVREEDRNIPGHDRIYACSNLPTEIKVYKWEINNPLFLNSMPGPYVVEEEVKENE